MTTKEVGGRGSRSGNMLRQVKLRPEAGAQYPQFPVGQWLPAADVAAQLLREATRRGERSIASDRILPEAHFEFEGGGREEMLRERARTRWSDYPAVRGDVHR